MEKKLPFILALIVIFSFVFLAPPRAQAGPEERYRWEGIAIGVGAAVVGSAILKAHVDHYRDRYTTHYKPGRDHRSHRSKIHRPHHRSGHWERQQEWVPPTYKRVWNPGHYNRHGDWVSGQWIEIVDQPGYWVEKKVWVGRR